MPFEMVTFSIVVSTKVVLWMVARRIVTLLTFAKLRSDAFTVAFVTFDSVMVELSMRESSTKLLVIVELVMLDGSTKDVTNTPYRDITSRSVELVAVEL